MRVRAPFEQSLDLPPPFTLVTLRERANAFTHAMEIAPKAGAGTLVYVGRFDLAEFAVVLEPEEPLRLARRAFYAGMVALSDALLAYAPPQKLVTIDWPDTIRIDGGLLGGGQLGWPPGAPEDEPPPWLVFGAMIRTVSMTGEEPGVHPLMTALEQEGFDDAGASNLTEAFARHLMAVIHDWQSDGFDGVARAFIRRLLRTAGTHYDIADNGDLLVTHAGRTDVGRSALLPALRTPSWFDPQSGGPRL
jgi:biotin-(acetyl-CoA carboxylase) ligase